MTFEHWLNLGMFAVAAFALIVYVAVRVPLSFMELAALRGIQENGKQPQVDAAELKRLKAIEAEYNSFGYKIKINELEREIFQRDLIRHEWALERQAMGLDPIPGAEPESGPVSSGNNPLLRKDSGDDLDADAASNQDLLG